MRFAAGILVVLVTVLMVRRGHRRGATDMLLGFLPLAAAIATLAALWRLDCLTLGGVAVGALLAVGTALGAMAGVRGVLIRHRRKRASGPGRFDRAAGAFLGLLIASYLCLILAEIGGTIVFGVTLSRPDERQNPPAESDALDMKWVDSLRDFSSAMADFSTVGLLRHVPYAGQYAHEVQCMVKILNASREDLVQVARKRGLFDLANIPEIRRALSDPDYQMLLLRARQGDLTSLYEIAENQITKDIFACRGIREFAAKLKLSDLLQDIESRQASLPAPPLEPCPTPPKVHVTSGTDRD